MFDNFELTLVRNEGLGSLSRSTCYISLNDDPLELISLKTLKTIKHVCTVPSKDELKISIEDQAILASVRFDLSIVKSQGYHWLPLYLNSLDSLAEVPEKVGLPRILLIFLNIFLIN